MLQHHWHVMQYSEYNRAVTRLYRASFCAHVKTASRIILPLILFLPFFPLLVRRLLPIPSCPFPSLCASFPLFLLLVSFPSMVLIFLWFPCNSQYNNFHNLLTHLNPVKGSYHVWYRCYVVQAWFAVSHMTAHSHVCVRVVYEVYNRRANQKSFYMRAPPNWPITTPYPSPTWRIGDHIESCQRCKVREECGMCLY